MQTYYQFYWNKIDEESIRILRIFGESEDVIVPETIDDAKLSILPSAFEYILITLSII